MYELNVTLRNKGFTYILYTYLQLSQMVFPNGAFGNSHFENNKHANITQHAKS